MCDPVSATIGAIGGIAAMAMAPKAPSMPNTPMPEPSKVPEPPKPEQKQEAQRPNTPQAIRDANGAATPVTGPAMRPTDTFLTGTSGVKLDDSNTKKQSLLGG